MEGVTAERLRAAFVRVTTPKPVPVIDLFHVAPVRASVDTSVRSRAYSCATCPAIDGAVDFTRT